MNFHLFSVLFRQHFSNRPKNSKLVCFLFFVIVTACITSCNSSDGQKKSPITQPPPGPRIPNDPIEEWVVDVNESPTLPQIVSQKKFDAFKDKNKIVVMVSIDGFRADYLEKLDTPNLGMLAKDGVVAKGLIPSFPTLTFPNHITLVTGRSPGHHGIVSNFFYDKARKSQYGMNDGAAVNDGTWYRGEPIWTVLEQLGIKTATCFWVGSEAKINGIDSTYVLPYDGNLSNEKRADQVITWLNLPEEKRPQFITLYFSDVDSAGHKFGADSKEVLAAAKEIDTAIGKIVSSTKNTNLDLQFVFVSDHGMNTIHPEKIKLSDLSQNLSNAIITERGATTQIYSDDASQIARIYTDLKKNEKNYKAYLRSEIPKRWKFNDQSRTGDILVVAEMPYYIASQDGFLPLNESEQLVQLGRSTHGWDPSNQSMHGLFLAQGSLFKKNLSIERFENVDVYPMILDIFGVQQSLRIDGNKKTLENIFKE